jgi:HSP20 family protein
LPGVRKNDVHVKVVDHLLTIEAIKKHDHDSSHDENNIHWHHEEHSIGKVRRSFRLPENVEAENIKAKLNDGILSLTIPKSKDDEFHAKKKKMIQIE